MGDQCKTILGPLLIKAPGGRSEDGTAVCLRGAMYTESLNVRDDLVVKGRIRSEDVMRVPRLVARTVKAPFVEGTLVNRFVNKSKTYLSRGDVVVLTMSTLMCPGNTGEVTIFLEGGPLEDNGRGKLAGVVIGNEDRGSIEFEEVPPGGVGFVTLAGICPMVKVNSRDYVIEEGDYLIAGPESMAVPENRNESCSMPAPRLGIALGDVEEDEAYAAVLIQPAFARFG